MQGIWLIDSDKRWGQVWQRGEGESWRQGLLGGALESPVLGTQVSLGELYAKSGVGG